MEPVGSSSAPIVAAFDVDKTLTQRDCVVPYLRRLLSWRVGPRLALWSFPLVWAGLRRDRDRVKTLATRITMSGLSRQRIESEAEIFAREIIASWLRDDTVQRLSWHRSQGHQIVLVSASYHSYLRHLGAHLGCATVLACEVDFDIDDRCTGHLVQGNCRGPEKERRLSAWLATEGLAEAQIFAYGDSSGDAELLAMATWATRVGPEPISAVPEMKAKELHLTTATIAESASS